MKKINKNKAALDPNILTEIEHQQAGNGFSKELIRKLKDEPCLASLVMNTPKFRLCLPEEEKKTTICLKKNRATLNMGFILGNLTLVQASKYLPAAIQIPLLMALMLEISTFMLYDIHASKRKWTVASIAAEYDDSIKGPSAWCAWFKTKTEDSPSLDNELLKKNL